MPEMRFEIEWPDGVRETCYSPSLVIKDYLVPGTSCTVPEFLHRSRTGLEIASARVAQKFGFPCSRALGQLARLEAAAARFSESGGSVTVLSFHDL